MSNCTMIKICVLGATDVGKTSIATRYVEDTYQDEKITTLGAAFLSRNCTASNGTLFKFHMWDTAGQER